MRVVVDSKIGTYTYPAPSEARPHAVSTAGTRSYSYNATGQMTSRNGTLLQWNGDGKPSSIGNVAFTYDGLGTRLKKTSGGQTTTYVGSDYEIAPDGTVTKYLLGGKQVGTEFFILHRDHLGSVRAVTDTAGAEVRSQQHTPFGDQHSVTGTHYDSRGWIGEREEETELVYLNARYYDPEIGRFTAPDPIAFPGQGLNRYTYALNNPINLSDPSGLSPIEVPFCVGVDLCFDLDSFLDNHPLADIINAEAQDDRDGHEPPTNPGGTTETEGPEPKGPEPPEGPQDPVPDNPLYNCGNGKKPNCPNTDYRRSRKGGGDSPETAERPVVSQTAPDLTFDGTTLIMFDTNGNVLGAWAGVSGREGYQDPRFQGKIFVGPIPEGNYVVFQSDLQRRPTGAWDRLEQRFYRGTWPGGRRSWGDWRVWITPASGTNTRGRANFSIHGGDVPGSAGCIDLCGEMPSFVDTFRHQGHDLVLRVQYPR